LREVVIKVFEQNRLVHGDFAVGGQPIDLRRIICPLLNVAANFDDLVPLRACEPLTRLVSSRDKETIVFPSSHAGMAASLAAHEKLWPAVGQWLGARDLPTPHHQRRPLPCEEGWDVTVNKSNDRS